MKYRVSATVEHAPDRSFILRAEDGEILARTDNTRKIWDTAREGYAKKLNAPIDDVKLTWVDIPPPPYYKRGQHVEARGDEGIQISGPAVAYGEGYFYVADPVNGVSLVPVENVTMFGDVIRSEG